jgi:hypothetical protein
MKGDRDSWLEPVSLSFFTIEGTMEKKLQDCDPWEAHDVIYICSYPWKFRKIHFDLDRDY